MSKAEQQELYKRIRNEWLDSLSYNEYDSLSRSKALDSLSLFCAKHEVNAVRIAREKEKERMALICVIELEKLKVRVREEMVNKFKGFLKKHEVMFFGCDCSDCKTMEDDFEESFLVSEQTGKDSSLNVINCVSSSKNEKDFVNSKSVSKETKKQNKNEVQKE